LANYPDGTKEAAPHLYARIVGGQIMMPTDLERLHKYMLDIEHIDQISDQMRAVVAPRKRLPCPYRKPKWLTIACESGDIRCYGRCL
jgi:hypothetical protein